MSIFPKRTKPGGSVTIHLGFGGQSISPQHQFVFAEIQLIDPHGSIIPIYNGHIFSLPIGNKTVDFDVPTLKAKPGLRQHVPYLLIADYLGGNHKKDQVFQLLKHLNTGKHHYFVKNFDKLTPLGKYTIASTFYVNGEPTKSKTQSDDFFFIEQLVLDQVEPHKNGFIAKVFNPSPEVTPAILVECFKKNDQFQYNHQSIELAPNNLTTYFFESEKAFLLYNEQREIIPLINNSEILCAKNPKLANLVKIENGMEKTYVFDYQNNDAYELEAGYKKLWDCADGLSTKSELTELVGNDVYREMVEGNLIFEFS